MAIFRKRQTLEELKNRYKKRGVLGRPNRFFSIESPEKLRNSARIAMHDILVPKKTFTGFIKESFSFFTTTLIIFGVLLLAANFQAYSQVIGHYWNKWTGKNATVQESLETLTVDTSLIPTYNSAGNINQDFDRPILSNGDIPDINIPILPPDNRIVIPKIAKNIPLKDVPEKHLIEENWAKLEEDLQTALKDGVIRYPGTARPGEKGNVFVTGHSSYYLWDPGSYKDVFALLHDVEVGDKITVYYDQDQYDYVVEDKYIVKPNDVDVLKQTDEKRLTLMTCTPIGTALNRLIIVAKQA